VPSADGHSVCKRSCNLSWVTWSQRHTPRLRLIKPSDW
jgi:hypothetical protein